MNFENLSSTIVSIIDEVLKNKNLVNYLGHNGDNPSDQNISPSSIAPKGSKERVFPHPFDVDFKNDIRTQLHIYYPSLNIENNGNVGRSVVMFDVVVHKDIWLLTDAGEKVIRPYQICHYILETFKNKNVKGIGKMHFFKADHVVVNDQFEGMRLVAKTTEF